jgi:hypothetical protein
MTDYKALNRIDFLPELAGLGLAGKARLLQSLIEENFFHPSGLFYSLLLIDGPDHVRPMARADLAGASVHAAEMFDDGGATRQAAQNEGMTFENSIYSAGLYLQAQAARYQVTTEPAAYAEGVRTLKALRLIYDHSRNRGQAGWLGKPYGLIPKDHSTPDQYHAAILGLYRFWEIAKLPEREEVQSMLRGIADFLSARNCQIWDLAKPVDGLPWNLPFAYCNATYVLAQAIAWRVTGQAKYQAEAMRLGTLSRWRECSHLEEWAEQGLTHVLEFERVCLGAFVLQAADALAEILPEFFGDTEAAAASALRTLLERWWIFSRLGIDGDGYQHYWIDIDIANRTWNPTGIRPIPQPPIPDTFFRFYSDVRWSDSLYRTMTGALPVMAHLPGKRQATLGWVQDTLRKTSGQRLRWMIDLDGEQLKPDVAWMGCMLSSEAPFHYLITYWRGRRLGYWT